MLYNFTHPGDSYHAWGRRIPAGREHADCGEPDLQWIVGQKVTQATNDKQQPAPTVKAVEEQARQKPQAVMTYSGNRWEANLKDLEKKKIEGFIATDKELIEIASSRARGTATAGSDAGGPHATETADQGGSGHLLQA